MNEIIQQKIENLKKKQNAIILAHNYQPPEIQEIADLCGDSLELSIKASKTDADVIVFCGVHFMAESASILSPEKTVILPKMTAGCPMADMITPDKLKAKIDALGNPPVVTYVNSPASVKALSTICCTSANVVKVVNSLREDELLMTPDRNLARYAASKTTKKIHLWEGYCPIHNNLKPEDVKKAKKTYPNALFIAHPECPVDVLDLADEVTSTSGMIRFTKESQYTEFIIGTEVGLLYPLKKFNPEKTFYPVLDSMYCEDMKKITLGDVANSLEHLTNQVKVAEKVRIMALKAVQRMIELSN